MSTTGLLATVVPNGKSKPLAALLALALSEPYGLGYLPSFLLDHYPTTISFIEFIVYLVMSEEAFSMEYPNNGNPRK